MNELIAAITHRLTDFPAATYCEHAFLRTPDQPFNIYSNLVFLLAAIMVVWLRRDQPSRSSWFIALGLIAVGAAGAWWHVTMSPLAHAVDIAASGALSLLMAYLVMRFVFYWPLWLCLPALPLLYLIGMGIPLYNEKWIAPGSVPLVSAAAFLLIGGIWSTLRHSNAGLYLLMASFWLAGGFVLLGLDHPGCEIIPIGTHFSWHLLAAASVVCMARAAAGADVELMLDFGRATPDGDDPPPQELPLPSNENELTPEELEKYPVGMPPDRLDPRDLS